VAYIAALHTTYKKLYDRDERMVLKLYHPSPILNFPVTFAYLIGESRLLLRDFFSLLRLIHTLTYIHTYIHTYILTYLLIYLLTYLNTYR